MARRTNPFKKVASIDEFLKVLRIECGKLRGKPYKHWMVPDRFSPHITNNTDGPVLHFTIDADVTQGYDKHHTADWYEIFEGTQTWYFRKGSFLSRWYGFDILNCSGGGSGKYSTTYTKHASISLKYMPKLLKALQHNESVKQLRGRAIATDPELLAMEKQRSELSCKISDRKQYVMDEFDKKNKTIDLFTGKEKK